MRSVWQFHTSSQLVFGWGAAGQLPGLIQRHGYRRILIVTDRVLAANGIVDKIRQPLVNAGLDVHVFDGG